MNFDSCFFQFAKIRKFLKPSKEKIHFLFRGAETPMKSKLSGMAKFILTFPGAA